MGLGEIALAGLGLVLVGGYAEKSGAGLGLGSLGTGVQTILAAPGVGVGLGLSGTAKGITDIGAAFGGIAKGIGSIFDILPKGLFPLVPWGERITGLVPDSGGKGSDLLPGGGGNVPRNIRLPVEFPQDLPRGLGRIYEVNGDIFGFRNVPGLTFESRRLARNYMNEYHSARAVVMEGTNV